MSVRGSIFAAIEARLSAVPGVASCELMPSGDPDAYPAIRIFDDGQKPIENEAGTSRYELAVGIEIHMAGGAQSYSALNDLHAAAVAALMTEPPLGGLAETIEDGQLRVNVAPLADERAVALAQDFTIEFATRRGSPATPA